jgi:peroxiredoxin
MARPPRRPAGRARRGGPLIRLLQPGVAAPGFVLTGSDGRSHALERLLAESHVLLVFYPGNNTPG